MTVAEDVIRLLEQHPQGLTDAQIAGDLGKPHAQVNQRCRQLAESGILARERRGGVLVNRLAGVRSTTRSAPRVETAAAMQEWTWEGNVQAALVRHLAATGWSIVSVAHTASQERGIDVVAERAGGRLLVEVKGWPSTTYARGERAGQPKPTAPTLQAKHWFAEALFAVLRLRERHLDADVAMCLPDTPRYRALITDITGALRLLGVAVLLVREDGSVESVFSVQPEGKL